MIRDRTYYVTCDRDEERGTLEVRTFSDPERMVPVSASVRRLRADDYTPPVGLPQPAEGFVQHLDLGGENG